MSLKWSKWPSWGEKFIFLLFSYHMWRCGSVGGVHLLNTVECECFVVFAVDEECWITPLPLTKTRLNWAADVLSDGTNANLCGSFLVQNTKLLAYDICVCFMSFCAVVVRLYHSPLIHKDILSMCVRRAQRGVRSAVCLRLETTEWQLLRAQRRAEAEAVLWTMTASRLVPGLSRRLWTLHLLRCERCQPWEQLRVEGNRGSHRCKTGAKSQWYKCVCVCAYFCT